MGSHRVSRDFAIALGAAMVAIACAFALSVGLAIRHSRVAGDTPYPAGSG